MPLKRSLTPSLLTFYGLGTILGAGVYALIGEVAKEAQFATPFAFLIASFIALLTGACYGELCSRYPQSAGSALYIRRAFNSAVFSGIVGWLVVVTGIVSAATLAHGFTKYFVIIFPMSSIIIIALLILFLSVLAIWGIKESAIVIMLMTLIEVCGLLLIIFYGKSAFTHINISNFNPLHHNLYTGVLSGAFIAFYAYIGFEDMVNTAEETINPEKNMPLAIFLAILFATILYLLIAWTLVNTLPISLLTNDNPMVEIIKLQGQSPILFICIAMIAIMNGILTQIIMGSRLIYGMASQQNAPKLFAIVSSVTKTPIYATLLVMFTIFLFAYALPITILARITSSIILVIFLLLQISLIKVKSTSKTVPVFSLPKAVPYIAFLLTLAFLLIQVFI